jgi:cytochrome c oxidase assembly protein subunit 15
MRRLAVGAVLLVMIQGLLGGLRVVMISVPLAVVHAAVAQLFFALLACMILFVSPMWLRAVERSPVRHLAPLRSVSTAVPIVVYLQILFGALLRHPGVGIDPILAAIHIGFAFVAAGTVFYLWLSVKLKYESERDVVRMASAAFMLVVIQIFLGVIAYFVLLDETGMVRPSNLQVIVNSTHLVVGALLFASTVATNVLVRRLAAGRQPVAPEASPSLAAQSDPA